MSMQKNLQYYNLCSKWPPSACMHIPSYACCAMDASM